MNRAKKEQRCRRGKLVGTMTKRDLALSCPMIAETIVFVHVSAVECSLGGCRNFISARPSRNARLPSAVNYNPKSQRMDVDQGL
jgi:hypothetical protein